MRSEQCTARRSKKEIVKANAKINKRQGENLFVRIKDLY
jgi:hypothetical protein